MGAGGKAGDAVLDPIRDEYRARIAKLQGADVTLVDVRSARRAAIEAERKALLEIAGRHDIDEHLLHHVTASVVEIEYAAIFGKDGVLGCGPGGASQGGRAGAA